MALLKVLLERELAEHVHLHLQVYSREVAENKREARVIEKWISMRHRERNVHNWYEVST